MGLRSSLVKIFLSLNLIADYCHNTTVTVHQNKYEEITSAFYPLYYANHVDCFWHITSAVPDGFIVFSFLTLDIDQLGADFLTAGAGTFPPLGMVLSLNGKKAPNFVTINGTDAWLRFTTDWNTQFSIGFSLEVTWQDVFGKCVINGVYLHVFM